MAVDLEEFLLAKVHVERDPTLSNVTRTAEMVQFAYHLMLFPYIRRPYARRLVNQVIGMPGVSSPQSSLRRNLQTTLQGEPYGQLLIWDLHWTPGFSISFKGLAEAIRELAHIFDPSRRADLKERARHDQQMNEYSEKAALIKLRQLERDSMLDTLQALDKAARKGTLRADDADALKVAIVRQSSLLADSLPSYDITSIDVEEVPPAIER